MPITNVLEAALGFIAMLGAVRALASLRLRGEGRSNRRAHDVTKAVALGVALALVPATRARAADAAAQPEPGASQRHAAVAAPEVETEARGDALKFDDRWFARPDDPVPTLAPRDAAPSAANDELDALTAATMAENAVHGAVAFGPPLG